MLWQCSCNEKPQQLNGYKANFTTLHWRAEIFKQPQRGSGSIVCMIILTTAILLRGQVERKTYQTTSYVLQYKLNTKR